MTDDIEAPAVPAWRPPVWATPSSASGEVTPDVAGVYLMAVLFVVAVVVVVAGRIAGQETLTLVGGYGVVFLGIGSAPLQLKSDLDLYTRLAGAVLIGFTVLLGIGAIMGDLSGAWHPVPAAVVVGAAAVLLHLLGVRRAHVILPAREVFRRPSLSQALESASPATRAGLLLIGCGTVLWLAPALWTRDPDPSFWGMLPQLGPIWFLGIGLVMLGFVVGRRSEVSAALGVMSFGLASTLTPALVYVAPRAAAAEKQIQLTQYVIQNHHIDPTMAIYPAFSAMFSGMAWLCSVLGIHGTLGHHSVFAIATYWPVLLVFARVAVLRLLTGRLLPTTTRRWCAVMLVLLVDSFGADYYSPQSIGYAMAVGCSAIAVKGLRPRPFGDRITFLILLLAGAALAPTHELSPYLLGGALVILAVFGQAPRWAWLPVTVPALIWAGVVHKAISHSFNFGSLFDISNFRPPVTIATPGLSRMPIIGYESHSLLAALLMLIGLGAIGFFANFRQRRSWAYALCPIVGIGLIAINPYGNEGIFRATLFAIPWMAVLAMMMPPPRRLFRWPATLDIAIAASLGVLLITFVIATYSLDATSLLPATDNALGNYVAQLPARNAFVLTIGSGISPADPSTGLLPYTALDWDTVATVPALVSLHPTASDLTALADKFGFVAAQNGASVKSPLYAVWTRSIALYGQEYGLQTYQQLETWLHLLKTSPNWVQVVRYGDSYLFRLK